MSGRTGEQVSDELLVPSTKYTHKVQGGRRKNEGGRTTMKGDR